MRIPLVPAGDRPVLLCGVGTVPRLLSGLLLALRLLFPPITDKSSPFPIRSSHRISGHRISGHRFLPSSTVSSWLDIL
jgi:hypothetical protein